MQLVHGATDGPAGIQGLVFPAGDLRGLIDDDARGFGGRFPHLGVGGKFLRRVPGDIAQDEGHGGTLANQAVCHQTGGYGAGGLVGEMRGRVSTCYRSIAMRAIPSGAKLSMDASKVSLPTES